MQAIGRQGITIGGLGRPGSLGRLGGIRRLGRLGRRTTVFLALIAFVAACSNQGAGPTNPPATQAAPSTAASQPAAASQPPAGGAVTLAIASDSDLGDYVTGADGMSLYVFLPDKGKDTSQCTGACAGNWPPLTIAAAGDVTAAAGVTGELGTITRDDGSLQVTLGGAPLYYYAADQGAGDVTGQGVNDVWYLASATGTAVGDEDDPAPQESSCGRYCY